MAKAQEADTSNKAEVLVMAGKTMCGQVRPLGTQRNRS
jgi:hypothetical protein